MLSLLCIRTLWANSALSIQRFHLMLGAAMLKAKEASIARSGLNRKQPGQRLWIPWRSSTKRYFCASPCAGARPLPRGPKSENDSSIGTGSGKASMSWTPALRECRCPSTGSAVCSAGALSEGRRTTPGWGSRRTPTHAVDHRLRRGTGRRKPGAAVPPSSGRGPPALPCGTAARCRRSFPLRKTTRSRCFTLWASSRAPQAGLLGLVPIRIATSGLPVRCPVDRESAGA